MSDKYSQAKLDAEAYFKEKENAKKEVEHQIRLQKDSQVRSSQELYKLREQEQSLFGEIQGIVAACRNLQSHINKLNQ